MFILIGISRYYIASGTIRVELDSSEKALKTIVRGKVNLQYKLAYR